MGARGEAKRELICARAADVFVSQGFSAVTMGDIVAACGISRGNLYMYFSSTEEVFLAVLEHQHRGEQDAVRAAVDAGEPTGVILGAFFAEQETELLGIDRTLRRATYEYWMSRPADQRARIGALFAAAVHQIAGLIERGIARGELAPCDPEAAARRTVLWLEGLSVLAVMASPPPDAIREQLAMIAAEIRPA